MLNNKRRGFLLHKIFREHKKHRKHDWIRASASMPVVSKIVELNGRKLLVFFVLKQKIIIFASIIYIIQT